MVWHGNSLPSVFVQHGSFEDLVGGYMVRKGTKPSD